MCGKTDANAGQSDGSNAGATDGDFEETSCFCLKRDFFVRKWFIHLVHWPWFERLSMVVIFVSCICLALADPLDRSCSEMKCQKLKQVNMFVLWFFVAEMVIKMTAMGLWGKRGYFSDGWNRLDFIIVIAGIVDEFSGPEGAFLIGIRLVRVLRPLRAINRVPSIRILVTLLLEALPLLGNVFALAFLVLFIFGIVGVQLWQGVLRNRCFLNSSLLCKNDSQNVNCYYQPSFDQPDFLCTLSTDSGMQDCTDMPLQAPCYHASGNYCYEAQSSVNFNNSHFSCLQEGPNPFYTTVSFDNIGYAWMVIFQIITLEGWTDIMYVVQQAYGYWNWVYFVILILIGPFFLVNLCLVVLAMQFQETKSRELQLLEEDRLKKLEAAKVFKSTRWGKAVKMVKTSISDTIQKRDTEHVHHHHHIHHYYHHSQLLQTTPTPIPMATTSVIVSPVPDDGDPPDIITTPRDSIIALEVTSNCKISQNFLSPAVAYPHDRSGRASPTWSIGSVNASDRISITSDTVAHLYDDSRNPNNEFQGILASVSVNLTSSPRSDENTAPNSPRASVFASAGATAFVTTAQVTGEHLKRKEVGQERAEDIEYHESEPREQANCADNSNAIETQNQTPPSNGQIQPCEDNLTTLAVPRRERTDSTCSCNSTTQSQTPVKNLDIMMDCENQPCEDNLTTLAVPRRERTDSTCSCNSTTQSQTSLENLDQGIQNLIVQTNIQNQPCREKLTNLAVSIRGGTDSTCSCNSTTQSQTPFNNSDNVTPESLRPLNGQSQSGETNSTILTAPSRERTDSKCGCNSITQSQTPLKILNTSLQDSSITMNSQNQSGDLNMTTLVIPRRERTDSTCSCNSTTQSQTPLENLDRRIQKATIPATNGQNQDRTADLTTLLVVPRRGSNTSNISTTENQTPSNKWNSVVQVPLKPTCGDNLSTLLTVPGLERTGSTISNTYTSQTAFQYRDKITEKSLSPQHTNGEKYSSCTSLDFKTLDISNLDIDSPNNDSNLDSPREIYRRKSYRGLRSVSHQNNTLSLPERERNGSRSSLDDRFGSIFDIQRYAQYMVHQEVSCFDKCCHLCGRLANSAMFINFIMIVIIVNTLIMATEHYGQSAFLEEFLEISNLIFIAVFFLELVIKIFGEGIRAYVSQWFNIFDGFIVLISIIEVIVLRGSGSLSVLRSIRLLRIFRLIRPIRHQLIVMVHTMASVVTFTALLFLFMFTFAVLGMNIFGGKMLLPTATCTTENVRSNFDTFFSAMVTVFQVLTLEDWNLVMRNAMRSTSHWAAVYFVTLTIIGYYVLLNLLVAILVEGFTNPLLFDSNAIKEQEEQRRAETKRDQETKKCSDWMDLIKRAKEQPMVDELSSDIDDMSDTTSETRHPSSTSAIDGVSSTYCRAAMRGVIGTSYDMEDNVWKTPTPFSGEMGNTERTPKDKRFMGLKMPFRKSKDASGFNGRSFKDLKRARRKSGNSSGDFGISNKGFKIDDNNAVSQKVSKPQIIITSADEIINEDIVKMPAITLEKNPKSLFIFSKNNRFRRVMINISTSKWFDYFILFLILVSCVFMVLDHPNASAEETKLAYPVSVVFTVLFTLEVVIKVIAQGLVMDKNAYLRVGWNILDFVIVIISWLHVLTTSFVTSSPGVLGSVKVLRGLRTIRPLRMIRRAPGLKLVVGALLRSLKPIGNTVLIAAIFFVVFGVLGIQLFKGTFYHCDGDPDVKTKQGCIEGGIGKWINRPYNFDNLPQALVTMFVLATRDGWVTMMHIGVDAVGVDSQPQVNYNPWKVIYYVSFLMVVGFLVLNMVVGIVVSNYQLCQEQQEQDEKRNKPKKIVNDDLVIEDKSKNVPQDKLYHQHSPFRRRCFRLCHNKYWDIAIAFVICVNVILMALEHYNMSENYKIFLEVNNYICTAIFISEAFIKLAAFGCRGYFQDRWNMLDFLVVIFSLVGICLDLIHTTVKLSLRPTVVRGLRVLRIVRVFKLFKVAKGVRSLLDTIANSLPQVANLGILLFLLFFIYSSLGIQLFGSFDCSGQYICHGFDANANFYDFPTAMLTLFRVATGDNWNTIYMDTLRSTCDASVSCDRNCCYSKYLAPVYFTTFVLATHFVLLNVLIAVLMKDLKASREKLAAVLLRDTLDKRVLRFTMSATKFVKQKAFAKRASSKEEIELEQVQSGQLPADKNG